MGFLAILVFIIIVLVGGIGLFLALYWAMSDICSIWGFIGKFILVMLADAILCGVGAWIMISITT